MTTDHRYNRFEEIEKFNQNAGGQPAEFADITPEQEQRVADRLDALIEHSREQLGD